MRRVADRPGFPLPCPFPADGSAPYPLLSPAALLIPLWPGPASWVPSRLGYSSPAPPAFPKHLHQLTQPLGTLAMSSRGSALGGEGQHGAQREATWQDRLLLAATHRLLLGTN